MLRVVHRATGQVVAALLALTMAGTVFARAPAADSCCCHRAQEHCHCPVCEHARELESGSLHLRQCTESHFAGGLAALPDLFPPSPLHAFPLPVIAPTTRPLFSPAEPPPLEVRTPPPMA